MNITSFLIGAAVGVIVAVLTFLGWLALAGAADDDCTSRPGCKSTAESAQ